MASSSQSAPIEGPVSLPLFKLSFCTTATHGSKLIWTHLSGNNEMFAVFDQIRKLGLGGSIIEKRLLKLTRGGDLLEQIELDDLLFQVRLDEARFKTQPVQDSNLYVIVIVKRPLIALRYQLPDGQIRRLQLNFLPESGYDVTFKIFASLGLPIRDKNTPPDPPVPNFSQPASQALYHNFSSSHPQESLTYHQTRAPSAPLVYSLPQNLDANSITNSIHIRPASSAPETYPSRQDDTSTNFSQTLPPRRSLPFPSNGSGFDDNRLIGVSAKACSEPHDTTPPSLTQMLPPVRILPFPTKKPRLATPEPKDVQIPSEATIADVTEASQTSRKSTAQAKKSNTKPQVAKPRTRKPKKSTENTGKTNKTSEVICVPSTPERITPRPNAVSPISPLTPRAYHRAQPKTVPSTANKRRSAPDPSSPLDKFTAPPKKKFDDLEPAEFMSRLDSWVREYHDLPAPKPRTAKGMDDLTAYAAQSKEDRLKVLDDMICECLQDENFGTLAKDVEDSWRRIGLGF